MLIWIWTRNDETGLLDDEFRDGDVFQTKPDSFEASVGAQEKKSFLIIKIPDPPNAAKFAEDVVREEYSPGPTAGDENVIRRKRIYRLPWRNKLSSAEVAIKEAGTASLVDGATAGGGVVTSGIVSGLFTVKDFNRK